MTTKTKTRVPSSAANGKQVATVEQWAQAGVHTVTCPSGAVVKIKVPDLSVMLAGDAVPEHLRVVAFQRISEELSESMLEQKEGERAEINAEVMKSAIELHRWIVTQAVVEPELTLEMLELLPAEDVEMIAQIATRERDTDALGVTLGVVPLSRFDTFRSVHDCGEACEACESLRAAFSTYGSDRL